MPEFMFTPESKSRVNLNFHLFTIPYGNYLIINDF
jgi:hypothetical protein